MGAFFLGRLWVLCVLFLTVHKVMALFGVDAFVVPVFTI